METPTNPVRFTLLDLWPLGLLDLFGHLHHVGVDPGLVEDDVGHLHGLLVMHDHAFGVGDVGVVELCRRLATAALAAAVGVVAATALGAATDDEGGCRGGRQCLGDGVLAHAKSRFLRLVSLIGQDCVRRRRVACSDARRMLTFG